MKNYSLTFAGLLAALIGNLLKYLGVDIDQEALLTTVSTLVTIGGILLAAYGRWRHGDVSVVGLKK